MLSAAVFFISTALSSITFVSPYPGSVWQSPESRIIINTNGDASHMSANVSGSISGDAVLSMHLSSDRQTVVFTPETPFLPGETITVRVADATWDFSIWPCSPAQLEPPEEQPRTLLSSFRSDVLTGFPVGFPEINFTPLGTLADGYYLFAPIYFGAPNDESYLVLMDNEGEPVMYRRMMTGIFCVETQPDGCLSYGAHLGPENVWFYEIDQSLNLVDSFHVEGYTTDIHDFTILQDSTVLLIGVIHQYIDMSQLVPGGDPNALVKGCIIQIQDRNHIPIFQWNSFDHIAVTDVATWVDLTSDYIDYMHCNSADEDVDGDLLISALALCAGVKISRSTGEVIFYLGGSHARLADFTIVGDPLGGFNGQHDFKGIGGGDYTLFDNGRHHAVHMSRALMYQVDTLASTATLSWSHDPGIYGSHAGSVQRMADGTTIVGWGTVDGIVDDFHEVTGSGEVRAYCRFVPYSLESYRVYKSDWEFQAEVPYLVAEIPAGEDHVLLTYHVFGEKEYTEYKIFTGLSPGNLAHVWTTAENQTVMWNLPQGMNYFGVTAIDEFSVETGMSNIDSASVTWTGITEEAVEPVLPTTIFLNPNPSSGRVILSLSEVAIEGWEVAVFDLCGRAVSSYIMEPGSSYIELSLTNLPEGVYVVTLLDGDCHSSARIVLLDE